MWDPSGNTYWSYVIIILYFLVQESYTQQIIF